MLVIQDVLISEDILEEQFHCNLNACKGACCREGDYGAPVTQEEMQQIQDILPELEPFLSETSVDMLQSQSPFMYYKNPGVWGTRCHQDGGCVFLVKGKDGIAKCGIENAFQQGAIQIKKPISCHLYPIRISKNEIAGFEAWNYDRWDICNAACTLGKEKQMPVFRFVKDAIIRLKGEEFYDELEAAYAFIINGK